MGRITSERSTPRRRRPLLGLQCPECTYEVQVASADLIEGVAVQCQHCGCEAEVAREFDEAAGTSHWVLVDPLAEDDEAEAARRN